MEKRNEMKSKVLDKFLRYVKIDTEADERSDSFPSTEKQKDLGRLLFQELKDLGVDEAYFDEKYGYVYGKIEGNDETKQEKTIAFISHMDTAPSFTGKGVNPRIIKDYDGEDIVLNQEEQIILSVKKFPEIKNYKGKTLITTDGTTLLGADDKAGVAEIMTMAEILISNPEIKHGPVAICFTPDEEVGAGVDHIDLTRLGADYGFTVDGGALGELEYENFNAASAVCKIQGVNVHPGEAKNKMKHAALIGMELEMMLPKNEKPQFTGGYEGFYHLTGIQGEEESARLDYIIRDHSREKFEEKKVFMQQCVDFLNQKYGAKTIDLEIKDSYYNMKEKIEPDYFFLIEGAKKCMEELGIEPQIKPIRGGTDGARLSYMGLPCPNLCAGGHNFHGRYEYVCLESMESIVELLVKLASLSF